MIRKLKNFKTISIIVCLLTIIAVSSTVHATEISNKRNIGVALTTPSTNSNSEITPYSTAKPSDVWNVKSDGQYNFSGWSYYQTLYTNYKFKGKKSYTIYIENTGSNPITVKAKKGLKTYGSKKIAAGKTGTITLSNMDKKTEFYISFSSGNEYQFNGYIK